MNNGLDPIIHQQTRLSIMASVTEVAAASFTHLRDNLGLSDGNLSRHLTVLEEAGYVAITKTFKGKTPHTAVEATADGTEAFKNYLNTLQSMIDAVQSRT